MLTHYIYLSVFTSRTRDPLAPISPQRDLKRIEITSLEYGFDSFLYYLVEFLRNPRNIIVRI